MATYTPDEIRQVLRAADDDRNGHLWFLALVVAPGRIAGLRMVRRRWDTRTVRITRTRVQAGAGNVIENDRRPARRVARCRWTTGWLRCCGGPRHATPRSAWRSALPT